MKTSHISKTQIIRHLIQIASFIAIPELFIRTLNAVKDIYQAILAGSFSFASQGRSLLLLAAILPITIIFGRFFCGYLCAFGSMQELLAFIAKKLKIKQLRISTEADSILKKGKYVVLVLLFAAWTLKISLDTLSPWTVFGHYSAVKNWTTFSHLFTFGGLLLVLIIIASLFSERVFCKYFCPIGGVFSLVSGSRFFKIRKSKLSCVSCGRCSVKCPMNIDVNSETDCHFRVRSGECIDCFRCTTVCPVGSLSTNGHEALSGSLAAAAIAGVYFGGTIKIPAAVGTPLPQITEAAPQGKYTDGTYHGTGRGFHGNVEVEVTVENGNITGIDVESFADDPAFFNQAKTGVINAILSGQSTEVRTVSGATFSSRGIIAAVENALSMDQTISLDAEAEKMPEIISQMPAETEPIVITPAEPEAVLPEAVPVQAIEEKTTANGYQDGIYQGTGKGRNGNIQVSVVVAGGKITEINVESCVDDAPYFSRAVSVIDRVLSQQSVDVQTVSGATMSSNGILEAVADALDLNFTNPNSSMQFGHGGGKGGGKNRGKY